LSQRNGDKSRYGRQRRMKILRRTLNRKLTEKPAAQSATKKRA
jgi:hypothetical protein